MAPSFADAENLLLTHGFSASSIEDLLRFHHSHQGREMFPFPWEHLKEALTVEGRDFFLVGYGSLLHPKSASRTIRDTPETGHSPVVALGARRVFNYQMPQAVFERYGVNPTGGDMAALNAEPLQAGVLNGRLIRFALSDLDALRARETAYDLWPVSCLDWDQPGPPFTAYVLCCPHEIYEGRRYVNDALTPYRPYYALCREGAEMVSRSFLSLYLKTTFLPDRQTSASVWEAH